MFKKINIILITVLLTSSLFGQSNFLSFTNARELRVYMKWHPGKKPLISAHRGGPMRNYPENAIETFKNALKYGQCIIECDVRRSKDNQLVMMHDGILDRTTTGKGKVSDFTLKQLKKLYLKDNNGQITSCRIPTFRETLQWAVGKAILMVDIKKGVSFQHVINHIKEYRAEGHAIVITYTYQQLKDVYQFAPTLMISANAKGLEGVKKILNSGVPPENLCAYVGTYEPDLEVYRLLHQKGILAILGTMHNLDNKAKANGVRIYQALYKNGADILSSDNVPLLSKAINQMKRDKILKLENPNNE